MSGLCQEASESITKFLERILKDYDRRCQLLLGLCQDMLGSVIFMPGLFQGFVSVLSGLC